MKDELQKATESLLELTKTFSQISSEITQAVEQIKELQKIEDKVDDLVEIEKIKEEIEKLNQNQ